MVRRAARVREGECVETLGGLGHVAEAAVPLGTRDVGVGDDAELDRVIGRHGG